jgi:hypothetical protein
MTRELWHLEEGEVGSWSRMTRDAVNSMPFLLSFLETASPVWLNCLRGVAPTGFSGLHPSVTTLLEPMLVLKARRQCIFFQNNFECTCAEVRRPWFWSTHVEISCRSNSGVASAAICMRLVVIKLTDDDWGWSRYLLITRLVRYSVNNK